MPYVDSSYNFGEVLQEMCRLVGHPVPVDPAGSTDQVVQQMGTVVNRAIAELLTMHDWEELTVKGTIVITGAGEEEKAFALPTDFYKFIDQTTWSGGSQLPAAGPVSNQAWIQYLVRNTSPQLTLAWQHRGNQLYVLAPPIGPVNFEFMYLSKGLVQEHGVAANTSNLAVNNDDVFVLDDNLILLLARAKYLEGKGFDSSGAMRDFLIAFNSRAGANKGAPILNIGSPAGMPLINPFTNLPDTGYGT